MRLTLGTSGRSSSVLSRRDQTLPSPWLPFTGLVALARNTDA